MSKKYRIVLTAVAVCLLPLWGFGETKTTETRWSAVFLGASKVGYEKETREVADGKVTTTVEMVMEISRVSVPIKMNTVVKEIETAKGEPLEFSSLQTGAGSGMKMSGIIEDGQIKATVETMGIKQHTTIPWPEGALMSEGARLLTVEKGFEEGTTYKLSQFMPDSLQTLPTTITVGKREKVDLLGRVVLLRAVEQEFNMYGNALKMKCYVNDDAETEKEVTPMMGMTVEVVSCTKEYALSTNSPAEFFVDVCVRCPRALSQNDRSGTLRYKLVPKRTNTVLSVVSSDEQSVVSLGTGAVEVTVRHIVPATGVTFPVKTSDPEIKKCLEPSHWIESDAQKIRKLAEDVVGKEKDAAKAAKLIEQFVQGYVVDKNLSVGYATALEVAEGREGDCSEHAMLATAMMRAAGIPARVATGLVYVDALSEQKHILGPHAWTQAYIGGKWISYDAAMGAFDTGHILMAAGNGDPLEFFALVNTLGNVEIEAVTVVK